jgi:hypothetical protein
MADEIWWSLSALNTEAPDNDYHSTVGYLDDVLDASENLACWRREDIEVSRISVFQLVHDSDDVEGNLKIANMRAHVRTGQPLPAVAVIHSPDKDYAYDLIEGQHRYNAVYREGLPSIYAWVAHLSCCGGPPPDLMSGRLRKL